MCEIALIDVYEAARKCLKGKRNTFDALKFEFDMERECVRLCNEINSNTYRPSRSIVFISEYPVKREIFGAAFRDRVAETIVIQKLTPLLEKHYIDDNYSTRIGKGTLYGVRRFSEMVRQCSENYTRDCYIMKLDVRSFFISLPKDLCYQRFEWFVRTYYHEDDIEVVLRLIRFVIFNRPELDCVRKSSWSKWDGLPFSKSLFRTDGTHGLPIGRGIVQITALLFLDELDHELKERFGVTFYGRYMDDMVFVDTDKQRLLELKDYVDRWLLDHRLILHPDKFYLQHYKKGGLFIGGMVMPGRVLMSNRTVGNWYRKVMAYNKKAQLYADYPEKHVEQFVAMMNSYFGIALHYNAWRISHRIMSLVEPSWYRVVNIEVKGRKMKCLKRKLSKNKKKAATANSTS